jgi:hypothetical protein
MKKTLTLLAALATAGSVFAQGTVEFGDFNSEIKRMDGTGASTGYTAGLFLSSDLNTALATTDFIAGTGFLNPVNVTVPGHPGRTAATFVIRSWATSAGSFAGAVAQGLQRGESGPFTVNSLGGAGSPPDVPASLAGTGYAGFTMVPEPSTYALGVLGLGALAMMRRRK